MFKVLVVNIGSTSFKYRLIDMEQESALARGQIERIGDSRSAFTYWVFDREPVRTEIDSTQGYSSAIIAMLEVLLKPGEGVIDHISEIKAVGFKTVHGGRIKEPALLTEEVLGVMDEYSSIMPAHNPPYINAIRRFKELLPDTPLVGIFETFFHADIPDFAYTYSIPYPWYQKYDIRKYGFHGSSHRYISGRASELLGKPLEELKIISCHLGGSSSIAAVQNGRCVDTSMGFTTQTGVPMAKRIGDIDPFIISYIMEKEKKSYQEVIDILVTQSGLLGISGISGDMRDLEENYAVNPQARLAVDTFVYQVIKYIGSYAVIMNGVDVIAFAGGIGENSQLVREKVVLGLQFLKIHLDFEQNNSMGKETVISDGNSQIKVLVVPTNEEIIVARETMKVVR
jgi:acetate kinase